ncbi:MAG: DUF2065 domain-containing protein [Pseudomonadota bacterium]
MNLPTADVALLPLILAALGLWFVIEGLAYAAAPDAMKRFLEWAAQLAPGDIRSAGTWTCVLGGVLLYGAMRLM